MILHRYILALVLRTFSIALVLLVFVFALGTTFKLLREDVSGAQLFKVLPFALLYTAPFILPIALLAAVTLAYGSLVARREVIAMRACGMSSLQIMSPALGLALLLSLLTAALEASVLPVLHYQRAALSSALIEQFLSLGEGRHKSLRLEQPDFSLYIDSFERGRLDGVLLRKTERGKQSHDLSLTAKRGTLEVDRLEQALSLNLEEVLVTVYEAEPDGALAAITRVEVAQFRQILPLGQKEQPGLGDLSSREVLRDYKATRSFREVYAAKGFFLGANGLYFDENRSLAELLLRSVTPFSSLVCVLIGVPLVLLLDDENSLKPFFYAFLVVTFAYFVPFMVGKSLAGKGQASLLLLYLGPGVGLLVGAILTVLAARR